MKGNLTVKIYEKTKNKTIWTKLYGIAFISYIRIFFFVIFCFYFQILILLLANIYYFSFMPLLYVHTLKNTYKYMCSQLHLYVCMYICMCLRNRNMYVCIYVCVYWKLLRAIVFMSSPSSSFNFFFYFFSEFLVRWTLQNDTFLKFFFAIRLFLFFLFL